MGRVFFVSDLHLGHRYVAGLRWEATQNPDYDWNPRTDVTDEIVRWHDDMLARNWDQVVSPDGNRGDQVWVLGDISGGGSKDQEAALAWLLQRPGTKHLISGNHDCLRSESRLLTRRGLVTIDEYRPYEQVLTVDEEGNSLWVTPEAVHRYSYDSES